MSILGAAPAVPLVSVAAGSVFADFSDKRYWAAFGHPSANALTFTNGGLNLKTSLARLASQKIYAGVKARFRLFPDAAGALEFKFTLENYTHGTDIAGSDLGCIGLTYIQHIGNLSMVGAGIYLNNPLATDVRLLRFHIENTYNGLPLSPNYQTLTGITVSSIIFHFKLIPATASSYGDLIFGTFTLTICKVSVNGAAFIDFSTSPGGPWNMNWIINQGLDFGLGLVASSRNAGFGARISSFQLIAGVGAF